MTAPLRREPISPELVLIDPELACPPDELEAVMIDSQHSPDDEAQPSLETLMFKARLIDADQLGELVRDAVVSQRSIEALALERNLVTPETVELLLRQPGPEPEPVEPDVLPHIALAVESEPKPIVEPLPPDSSDDPVAGAAPGVFDVVVRLTNGETVPAGGVESREGAEGLARTTARLFADASEWPLVAGRCLRPDLVVSVDVVCRVEDS